LLQVRSFRKEGFGGLKPSSASELNVYVTGGVERRHLCHTEFDLDGV
jgi:hypothetical protein